jgi:hypothetical protein
MGRGSYDYWAGYWPHSDVQPFADFINRTTKHVFTSSELEQSWPATVLADHPLAIYVEQLKNRPGGDIGVHGSIRARRERRPSCYVHPTVCAACVSRSMTSRQPSTPWPRTPTGGPDRSAREHLADDPCARAGGNRRLRDRADRLTTSACPLPMRRSGAVGPLVQPMLRE